MNRDVLRGKKAAIFDMDGTIIDTLPIWGNVDIKFLSKRGLPVPDDYFKLISLMSFEEAAQYTKERFSLVDRPEEIIAEWIDFAEQEYVESAKVFPNVVEYLEELKSGGIKIALATSAIKRFYESALTSNNILEFFDVLCSVDEAGAGKEKPDIYYLAMKKLEIKPCECVIFEDVEEAALSALKTGASVYLVDRSGPLKNIHNDHININIKTIRGFDKAPIIKY
ncbi:MAG: HAD family phosphatase [Eubacterium sp.]|jgi:HAD superfamily hydrolase (TIGR01509 family)|nr:HAD family phosphatase [Eubacterium sp.]